MGNETLSHQELVEQLKRAEEILEVIRLGQADAVIGKNEVLLLSLRAAEEELHRTSELFKQSVEILELLRLVQADESISKNADLLPRLRAAEEQLQRTSELFGQSIAGAGLVAETVSRSIMTQSELEYLRAQFWKDESNDIVRTQSPTMEKIYDQIQSVAPTMTTVLLTGETGTGKGVMAKLIHRHSTRGAHQFISVHCGTIPDTLIESELFGHEKGAFTGAVMRKLGKFEIAQGGTLFLDEIGTVTPSVQIKLLQVLQEKIYSRVGGEATIKADFRIIAASNADLPALVQDGSFREDLFYRLNVFPIEVPPLRKRVEDIPLLAQEFLAKCNRELTKKIPSIHPSVIAALRRYPWPGNIRELENLIERAHIVEQSRELTPESFPAELFVGGSTAQVHLNTSLSLAAVRQEAIESIERQYLKQLLAEHKGKIDASAMAAGVGSRQIHKLLTKYKIEKGEYKIPRRRTDKPGPEL